MENLHPLVVHFPIALLVTALALELAGLLWRSDGLRRVALWNQGLGTVGVLAAVITGRLAKAGAKHSPEIFQVMSRHEQVGYVVGWLTVAALGWRLATTRRRTERRYGPLASRRRAGPRDHWIGWGVLALLCGLLAFGAHLGGRLVYEYGVGGVYGRAHSGIEVVDQ